METLGNRKVHKMNASSYVYGISEEDRILIVDSDEDGFQLNHVPVSPQQLFELGHLFIALAWAKAEKELDLESPLELLEGYELPVPIVNF